MYKKFFHSLQNLGVDISTDPNQRRKIKLTNTVSILFTLICFFYIPLFFYMGSQLFTCITIVVTISYACPLVLNLFKQHTLAKFWFIGTISFAVFLYTLFLGMKLNIYMAYYPGFFMPFILFDRNIKKDRIFSYICILFISILFLINFQVDGEYLLKSSMNLQSIYLFSNIMLLVSILLSSIGIISLNNDARFAEIDLKKALEEKNHLISIVCHDIANPLSISLNYSRMIIKDQEQTNSLDENSLMRLKKAYKANHMIKDIIKNVRTLESHSSGKSLIKTEAVNINECIDDMEFVFYEKLKTKNIKLEINKIKDESPNIIAEKTSLLNNVLNNIISNAIKFSFEDSKIVLSIINTTKGVEIIVRDFGLGMEKHILENIFSDSFPTTRKGTSGEIGTGFGMPIVMSTLNKYGASIEIESISSTDNKNNSGTTIKLQFQRA